MVLRCKIDDKITASHGKIEWRFISSLSLGGVTSVIDSRKLFGIKSVVKVELRAENAENIN